MHLSNQRPKLTSPFNHGDSLLSQPAWGEPFVRLKPLGAVFTMVYGTFMAAPILCVFIYALFISPTQAVLYLVPVTIFICFLGISLRVLLDISRSSS